VRNREQGLRSFEDVQRLIVQDLGAKVKTLCFLLLAVESPEDLVKGTHDDTYINVYQPE
jgi:hypothetical protein